MHRLGGALGEHPPFGHDGERVLSELTRASGAGTFLHNLQSIQFLDRIERRLTELMTEGQQHGELRTDQPPRQLARGYMAGYYGLRVLGQSRPEREFLTDIVNDTLARL